MRLTACGLPTDPPDVWLPGWGNDLRNLPTFGLGLRVLF